MEAFSLLSQQPPRVSVSVNAMVLVLPLSTPPVLLFVVVFFFLLLRTGVFFNFFEGIGRGI